MQICSNYSLSFNYDIRIRTLLRSRWKAFKKRTRANVPGPDTNFFLGNVLQIAQFMWTHEQKQLGLFKEWKDKYGKVVGFFIGPTFNIVVEDLDMVREILVTQFHNFEDRMFLALCQSYPIGDSIMCLKGSDWKFVRTVFTPSFSIRRMKQMCSLVGSKLKVFLHNLELKVEDGETFDIQRLFQNLTLDVFGQCAFAVDSNCQIDPQDPFYLRCRSIFDEQDFEQSWLIRLAVLFPEFDWYLSKLRPYSKFGKSEIWLSDGLRKVVNERKRNFQDFQGIDLVQLAVEQWDREMKQKGTSKLTTEMIVANCFIFLLAGYETASTALSFVAWLMAKHQDKQEILYQEISKHPSAEKGFSYDDLNDLPYLDAFFKEALRLYPPVVYFLCRECVMPCTIKRYNFNVGDQIIIPVYNIHRDPDIWPDPERFDPQRFMKKSDRHPMSWIPFGAGQRNCIGSRFADMECKMTMACMVNKFKLILAHDSQDPLKIKQHGAMLAPKNGIKVRVEKRV